MLSHSRQLVFRMLVLHALLVCAAAQAASWRAEDITDWELAGDDLWKLNGDRLVQVSPGDTSAALLDYWAGPKGAQTDGDFTLTARAGFNPEGYPLGENGKINWRIYYRTIAVGVMADSANGIFAVFSRSNGEKNGIVRLVDGKNIWLVRPTGGQGVGLDIHDVREYRMSRQGRQITVWLDSVPVFQAEDTLGVLAGRPVVCGPGPVGVLLEGMSLVHRAAEAPKVEMAAAVDSFIVGMENGSGPVLRDIYGKPIGTVELGDSLFGWWTNQQGGKSWVAAGGQLSIPNFRMAPEATIECWFRLLEVPPGDGLPILHFCFDGTRMDSSWLTRERGGPMARVFPDSSIGLHFHEFGDANADLPGIFKLGKWTHLAWVRQGALHRIYVDGKEVLSLHLPKYGERPLTGMQLNVAQNADHDWITEPGRPYLELNSMRAVPRALEPKQLQSLARDYHSNHSWNHAKYLQDENGVPSLFSLGPTYPNPYSLIKIISVSIPYGYGKDVWCELRNFKGEFVSQSSLGDMQPGVQQFNWYVELVKGRDIESGVYFLSVRAGKEVRTRKIVILSSGERKESPRPAKSAMSPSPQPAAAEKPEPEAVAAIPVDKNNCEFSLETYMSSPGYDAMIEVAEGCEGKYRLAVMRGRNTAKVIYSGMLKSGIHRFNWDGTGADGNQLLGGAHDMVLSGHGREIRRSIVFLR